MGFVGSTGSSLHRSRARLQEIHNRPLMHCIPPSGFIWINKRFISCLFLEQNNNVSNGETEAMKSYMKLSARVR